MLFYWYCSDASFHLIKKVGFGEGGHFVFKGKWESSAWKRKTSLREQVGESQYSPLLYQTSFLNGLQSDESKLVLKRQCKLNHLIIRVLTNHWKT